MPKQRKDICWPKMYTTTNHALINSFRNFSTRFNNFSTCRYQALLSLGGVALTLVHSKMPFQQHQMNNIDRVTYVKIVRYKDVRYT